MSSSLHRSISTPSSPQGLSGLPKVPGSISIQSVLVSRSGKVPSPTASAVARFWMYLMAYPGEITCHFSSVITLEVPKVS